MRLNSWVREQLTDEQLELLIEFAIYAGDGVKSHDLPSLMNISATEEYFESIKAAIDTTIKLYTS